MNQVKVVEMIVLTSSDAKMAEKSSNKRAMTLSVLIVGLFLVVFA